MATEVLCALNTPWGHVGPCDLATILQKQSNLLKLKGNIWLPLTLLPQSPQSDAFLPPHAQ